MGAIQNAINSMIGTVAAASIGIKKLGEAKQAEKLEGIELTEKLPAIEQEIAQGQEELTTAQQKLEKTKTGRTERGQFRKKSDVKKDIEMQQRAISALEGKQQARVMQRDIMQKRYNQLRGVK